MLPVQPLGHRSLAALAEAGEEKRLQRTLRSPAPAGGGVGVGGRPGEKTSEAGADLLLAAVD